MFIHIFIISLFKCTLKRDVTYLREALGNKTLVRGQVGEVST